MRILYLSNGYPPHRWAGTEHHTAAIAEEFTRRGAQVRVICAGDWDRGPSHVNGVERSIDRGIDVCRVQINWMRAPDPFGYLSDNPAAARIVGAELDEFRPDVVHVTSCETLSASPLGAARQRGVPLVLSLTDFWFLCPRINLLRRDGECCDGLTTAWECLACLAGDSKVYRWPRALLPEAAVERLLTTVAKIPRLTRRRGLRGLLGDMDRRKAWLLEALRWPDVRVTASPFVRAMHERCGAEAEILVRPYGHDLSWLGSNRGKTASDAIRIGYVGQIVPSKGVHLLVEAWRQLPPAHRDRLSLVIYGDPDKVPDYGRRLRSACAGLPGVRFMGTYAHDDSARVYASIDVLAVPSLWYDFPLVIHEALATKTPVIATNLGGMAESVHDGRNGLLFDKGDVRRLGALLAGFAADRLLLAKLRDGIEPVKTIDQEADELEECYRRLAAGGGGSGGRA